MTNHDAIRRLGTPIEDGTKWPAPLCPQCLVGLLLFEQPALVQNAESKREQQAQSDNWEPEWIFGSFSVAAGCNNPECGQKVLFSGQYEVDFATTSRHGHQTHWFRIEYATPSLAIMTFPKSTPENIQTGVSRAARLLLADPPSAANALRATAERFLTLEGIPARTAPNRDGQTYFLAAHSRIELWRTATGNNAVADLLLAVKWIGNDGSHEVSGLSVADVLDGVTILEEAWRRLYDTSGDDIDAKARAINAHKGHV